MDEQKDGWDEWKSKYVYVELFSGRKYKGSVQSILRKEKVQMTLIDKFNKKVRFHVSDIKLIQEEAQ